MDAGLARRHLMGESIGAIWVSPWTWPGWARGACRRPGPRFSPSAAWLSANPEMREAARHACQSCPALAPCRRWALSLPEDGARDRNGPIAAGWDRAQLRAARRAAWRTALAQPLA